jgi:hypothetical protein
MTDDKFNRIYQKLAKSGDFQQTTYHIWAAAAFTFFTLIGGAWLLGAWR